jgi:hypothetical protein
LTRPDFVVPFALVGLNAAVAAKNWLAADIGVL